MSVRAQPWCQQALWARVFSVVHFLYATEQKALGSGSLRNTLELAFELECEGHSIGTHVGIPDGMQCDDIGPLFVAGILRQTKTRPVRVSVDCPRISRTSQVLNHIFQLAYTVELIFRLWYHRQACVHIGKGYAQLLVRRPGAGGSSSLRAQTCLTSCWC